MSETSKIRARVWERLANGRGLDLGCGADKITVHAIGVNLNWGGQGDRADFWFDLNEPLPTPNETWDYVFSSHLLEHLAPPPEKILADWWRVLRPNGYLVLYLPHKNLYTVPNPEHLRMWTTEEMLALVQKLPGCVILDAYTESLAVDGPERYSFLLVAQKKV